MTTVEFEQEIARLTELVIADKLSLDEYGLKVIKLTKDRWPDLQEADSEPPDWDGRGN